MKKNFFIFITLSFFVFGCTSTENEIQKELGVELKFSPEYASKSSFSFIKANNDFAYKTFSEMLEDYANGKLMYIKDKNIVYSPYSYIRALSLLNKITEKFNSPLMDYARKFDYTEIGKLKNLDSADIALLNSNFYNEKNLEKNMAIVNFPKQAEQASINLQREILKEVLLQPEYETSMTYVILNASRFLGYWAESFDKNATLTQDFTLVNGKRVSRDIMSCTMKNALGFENIDVALTYKTLTEKKGDQIITSKVYVVVPKIDGLGETQARKKIAQVGANLKNYIGKPLETFDKVYLRLPKLKEKTTINLLEMSDQHNGGLRGQGQLNDKFVERRQPVGESISGICQVATLEIDEEKVEAKAVTEIITKATSVMPMKERILRVNADRPHFIVITSLEGDAEAISFICLITEPSEG